MEISAVVLTKNEEKNIAACLGTLAWCDEIIIVDDDSCDKTPEIAKKFGAKVFQRKLGNDFSKQRNFGLEKANGEWVLFIDADERISEKLAQEIKKIVKERPLVSGFYLKRKVKFLGRWLKHGEAGRTGFLRLARRGTGKWQGRVHEEWQAKGKKAALKEPLIHKQNITLSKFIKRINFYSTLRAQELKERGRKFCFFELLFFPPLKFMQNFFLRQGFLDGMPGLILAILMSTHSFFVRAKLFMLWKKARVNPSLGLDPIKGLTLLGLLILDVGIFIYLLSQHAKPYPLDFNVFWQVAGDFKKRINLYQLNQGTPFNYPPTTVLFLIPLSFLSKPVAYYSWQFFSFGSLCLSLLLLIRLFTKKNQCFYFSIFLLLSLLYFPARFTLGMGQINLFILLFLTLFFFYSEKNKPFKAGLSLAVSLCLKLIPAIFLFYLLIKKKLKTLLFTFLSLLIIVLLTGFLIGWQYFNTYFLKVLPSLFSQEGKEVYYNQALSGVVARLSLSRSLASIFNLGGSVFLLVASFWAILKFKGKNQLFNFSLFLPLALMINGFSWQHHFVWLLPSFIILFFNLLNSSYKGLLFVLGISFLLTSHRFFPSHVFLGTFILWVLNLYLLKNA